METERSPDELCLCCLDRKSIVKGSHLIPNGIIKYCVGNRGKEEQHTFPTYDADFTTYFGSGNLKNQNPKKEENSNVKDYIFCKECEKGFESLETPMSEFLNEKLYDPRFNQHYEETQIAEHILVKKCLKLDSLKFTAFVYSVIWRMCLFQKLNGSPDTISSEFEEKLRQFLYIFLYGDKELITVYPYPYTFISNMDGKPSGKEVTIPFFLPQNPELFFICKHLAFIHDLERIRDSIFPMDIIRPGFANEFSNQHIKLVFIANSTIEIINHEAGMATLNDKMQYMAEQINVREGMPVEIAIEYLKYQSAKLIQKDGRYNLLSALKKVFFDRMNLS